MYHYRVLVFEINHYRVLVMNHEYFERKPEGWNIVDFLNRCGIEPYDAKIDRYIKSLKAIADEQGEGERAEKANKNSFTCGVSEGLLGCRSFKAVC